ncbi:zinc finger protein STAR3-like [Ananas comosus]|uniref:Protein SENSITIVE TO PROTON RHIZOTOXICITY 1 n=1 Tax=Ananas comosus TaxID=4615 RepID=A0A199VE05_ANACO|nr:zinc finger protein STAR3-like [Ananas comosus]OAY75347.1 Protein SENSITIVE TO PROTON RHIZOTOXICITY 1 [Ananas comosus]
MMNNQQGYQAYQGIEDMLSLPTGPAAATASCAVDAPLSYSLLYNVSALCEKIQQLESYVGIIISPSRMQQESVGVAVSDAGSLAKEIIVSTSSIMYALQQIGLETVSAPTDELLARQAKTSYEDSSEALDHAVRSNNLDGGRSIVFSDADVHYSCNPSNTTSDHMTSGNNGDHAVNSNKNHGKPGFSHTAEKKKEPKLGSLSKEYDVIELNAADLLAMYSYYCQVCGKGFKRDANLRMHMRAHGDEYKTTAALTNPAKTMIAALSGDKVVGCGARKYSCPQEGCRWNKKHPRFTPLKSLVCMKNHYKRRHCPKMYVCKRCEQKQFSLLSDLRTHEKHCGDLRWRCSCGTNFSRKDKLMGHVALFVGHTPIIGGASCSFTKN